MRRSQQERLKRSGQCERRKTVAGEGGVRNPGGQLGRPFCSHYLSFPGWGFQSHSFSSLTPLGPLVASDIIQLGLSLEIIFSLELTHRGFSPCVSHDFLRLSLRPICLPLCSISCFSLFLFFLYITSSTVIASMPWNLPVDDSQILIFTCSPVTSFHHLPAVP